MPLQFAIEGHDGAAKTPVLERTCAALREKGHAVEVCAPYALANERLAGESVRDVYLLWAAGGREARRGFELLSGIVESARARARGVLLFDRHWMSVLRCLEVATGLPAAERDALAERWRAAAPPTFFLEAPPSMTRQARRFTRDAPWTATDAALDEEYRAWLRLLEAHPAPIVGRYRVEDRAQDLAPIVADVTAKILSALEPSADPSD